MRSFLICKTIRVFSVPDSFHGALPSSSEVSLARDLRLGQRFTFQQDDDPKHTVKQQSSGLREKFKRVGMAWSRPRPPSN